jgi:ribonuclease HI
MVPKAMKKASLITDGSCLGNPGPGGWACILRFGAVKKELFGYDPHTTNNRMELMAAIQGLLAFKEPCEVEITTDAEYVRQGMMTPMTLKMRATRASGPISPHIEQAQTRQAGFFQKGALQVLLLQHG